MITRNFYDILVVLAIGLLGLAVYTQKEIKRQEQLPPTVKVQNILDTYKTKTIKVKATFFNATVRQCDGEPNCTARGFKLNMWNPYSHRILAVSRDLLDKGFKMGMKVYLRFPKGTLACYDGLWVVRDLMGGGSKNMIDLLVNVDMPMATTKNVELITITE